MGIVSGVNKYKITFENGSVWFAGEHIDCDYTADTWKIEILRG
jgi:hypothetical protein